MSAFPAVTRTYRSWILDSTRWQHVAFRDGDVVVTTPYKSGTTWMIHIAGLLIFDDLKLRPHRDFGTWIDKAFEPIEEEVAAIEAMQHPRVFKTHLPLDGLPFHEGVRYIYVARDFRDIVMSLWNHHTNYTPEAWARMTEVAAGFGMPMAPEPPADIRAFWRDWATLGYFEGDLDGFPYWSATAHFNTWWAFRDLPNLMFVHFNDLLADLPGEVARIARFMGLPKSTARCAEIAHLASFATMKREATVVNPGADFTFRGGATTFIHKGTNGRWRGVLTAEDLVLYEQLMRRVPASAASWLERGGTVGEGMAEAGQFTPRA